MRNIALNPGDIIDVVAPSSARYDVSTEQIIAFVSNLGYKARVPNNMQVEGADPFSANTDEERYKQLLAALQAPDSQVIWFFKGGYGSQRLLPLLDKHDFSAHPKLLLGFSDITALCLYFHKKYRWPYVHCRMIGQYVRSMGDQEELRLIKHVLAHKWNELNYHLTPVNSAAKNNVSIKGKIIGGNLSLIQCSLGTNWSIDTHNKILFIEEVDERGYALHRILIHLAQAGVFDNILALIIGDIACKPEPNSGEMLCEAALSLFLSQIKVPVFRNNNFGHGSVNYPLVLGVDAEIVADKEFAKLSFITTR